jgi:hypothetical protein
MLLGDPLTDSVFLHLCICSRPWQIQRLQFKEAAFSRRSFSVREILERLTLSGFIFTNHFPKRLFQKSFIVYYAIDVNSQAFCNSESMKVGKIDLRALTAHIAAQIMPSRSTGFSPKARCINLNTFTTIFCPFTGVGPMVTRPRLPHVGILKPQPSLGVST